MITDRKQLRIKVEQHIATAIKDYAVPKELYRKSSAAEPVSHPERPQSESAGSSYASRQQAWLGETSEKREVPIVVTLLQWLSLPEGTPYVADIRRTLCGWILNRNHPTSRGLRDRLTTAYKHSIAKSGKIGQIVADALMSCHQGETATIEFLLTALVLWATEGKYRLNLILRLAEEHGKLETENMKELVEWLRQLPNYVTPASEAVLLTLGSWSDAPLSIDEALRKYA